MHLAKGVGPSALARCADAAEKLGQSDADHPAPRQNALVCLAEHLQEKLVRWTTLNSNQTGDR